LFKRDESVERGVEEYPGLPIPHLEVPVIAAGNLVTGWTNSQKDAADVSFRTPVINCSIRVTNGKFTL